MLALQERIKRYHGGARPLAEIAPWLLPLTSGLVLNKDGALLACYRFRGIDAEGREKSEIDDAASRVEKTFRVFNRRIATWWTTDRMRTTQYADGDFSNSISRMVNERRRQQFLRGRYFANEHYLAVTFSPEAGPGRLLENIHRLTANGHGMVEALITGLKHYIQEKDRLGVEIETLAAMVAEFETILDQFRATMPDIGLERLLDDDLHSYLHWRLSPATDPYKIKIPTDEHYLDTALGDNVVTVQANTLRFDGVRSRYAAALTIKTWPDETLPGLLDCLLAAPVELTVSYAYRLVDQDQAKQYIKDVRRHNRNMRKGLFTLLKEVVTNTKSENTDNTRDAAAHDADDALGDTATKAFGYLNVTIMVYGDTPESTEEAVRETVKLVHSQGFITLREGLHLLSAWAGTVPGQWAEPVRWLFFSSANVADLAHIRSIATGSRVNEYLTEQRQRYTPALTTLATEYNTPYYFNFHQGDLAHTAVIGPTRSGKSVFVNFLISQWLKYEPVNVFIFDKDYSCRIPTLLQGGRHLDLANERVELNPTALLEDKANWPWFARWLEILLASRDYRLTADDDVAIHQAIESVAQIKDARRRLQSFFMTLPSHLATQLSQWIGSGALAQFFDHEVDAFDLGRFTCIEMGRLFQTPVAARAFLDYAFYRINQQLDGSPTLIYLEEVWFLLEDEHFAMKLNDWLRTLAKKNAFVVLATQSLDELAQSKIFTILVDSIPTRIFLANPNAYAHKDLYQKKFGLNNTQLDRIRTMVPKRQYYITTPNMSRMVEASLEPEVLAVMRSDKRAQDVFLKHYGLRDQQSDWQQRYILEVSRET